MDNGTFTFTFLRCKVRSLLASAEGQILVDNGKENGNIWNVLLYRGGLGLRI